MIETEIHCLTSEQIMSFENFVKIPAQEHDGKLMNWILNIHFPGLKHRKDKFLNWMLQHIRLPALDWGKILNWMKKSNCFLVVERVKILN